jgi:hypothetical protein
MRKRRHERKTRRNGFSDVDVETFRNNQNRLPARELKKYNGKYVAWSPDGTHIVASDKDPEKLCKKLVAHGYKPGEVLVDTVVFPAEVGLGGASLFGENGT